MLINSDDSCGAVQFPQPDGDYEYNEEHYTVWFGKTSFKTHIQTRMFPLDPLDPLDLLTATGSACQLMILPLCIPPSLFFFSTYRVFNFFSIPAGVWWPACGWV
jgi:hypothetical protein